MRLWLKDSNVFLKRKSSEGFGYARIRCKKSSLSPGGLEGGMATCMTPLLARARALGSSIGSQLDMANEPVAARNFLNRNHNKLFEPKNTVYSVWPELEVTYRRRNTKPENEQNVPCDSSGMQVQVVTPCMSILHAH